MKKKLVIVHGDKGGVGKTTFAGLTVDYFLERTGKCVVVEGDKKIPDVAARFSGVPGVEGKIVDLARPDLSEEAIVALFSEIEKIGGDHVVINLPAGASSTIDAQSEILYPAAHELGFEVCVFWLLGQEEDSIRLLTESSLCQCADRKMVVINGHYGDPTRSFWWAHNFRTHWIQGEGMEGIFPDLTDRVIRRVREMNGRYTDMVKHPDFTIIERQAVKRWIDKTWEGPIGFLLEDSETNDTEEVTYATV